jgi:virginiamycin B lyase
VTRRSVLALAAAREDEREDRQGEQNQSMSHERHYGRAVRTVCTAVLVAGGAVSAAAAPQPVARIVTGAAPCGAVSGPGSVWVAVYGTGNLVRIDPRSNRVARRIRLARGICPLAIGGGSIWVASDRTNLLYRVDPRRGRVVARVRVAEWPAHVAVAFGSVWVSAYEQGTVARIEPRTNGVARVYVVGGNPSGMTAAGGSLWIAFGRNGSALGRLDPASGELTKVRLGHTGPGSLSLAAGSLWTTTADGYAIRVDPAAGQVVATFPIPGTPAEVGAAPDGTIWVAEKERNTLTRIDPVQNRILDVTGAGRGAFSIAAAAGDMWVTSFAGSDIWRFRGK